MCLSIFCAQVIGLYLFLVSLATLVHQQRCRKTAAEFSTNHALVCLTGGLNLLFGLIIVVMHNIWVAQWPVLITIIGWLLVIQGVLKIFFPDTHARYSKNLLAKSGFTLLNWIFLIVGIYLVWMGFAS